jgi:hypothetical protein
MTHLFPAAQEPGLGIRLAHDPGDPLITSHCPFCGSGQVIGRSDGTIECDFCGQNYIVRVQPAFPGMPQAPAGPGAPSDIGPDGGVMPPGALPPEAGIPPADGAEEDAEDGGNPFGGDDEELPPDDGSGPPEDEEEDEGPPPPPKGKSKKKGSYRSLDGTAEMDEDQFTRHVAVQLSGHDPQVLAAVREDAPALRAGDRVTAVLDEGARRAFWDSEAPGDSR